MPFEKLIADSAGDGGQGFFAVRHHAEQRDFT